MHRASTLTKVRRASPPIPSLPAASIAVWHYRGTAVDTVRSGPLPRRYCNWLILAPAMLKGARGMRRFLSRTRQFEDVRHPCNKARAKNSSSPAQPTPIPPVPYSTRRKSIHFIVRLRPSKKKSFTWEPLLFPLLLAEAAAVTVVTKPPCNTRHCISPRGMLAMPLKLPRHSGRRGHPQASRKTREKSSAFSLPLPPPMHPLHFGARVRPPPSFAIHSTRRPTRI